MKWILIWALFHWDGVATGSTPFDTQKACEAAAHSIRTMEGKRLTSATAKCFASQ